jgi:hypothetical protein
MLLNSSAAPSWLSRKEVSTKFVTWIQASSLLVLQESMVCGQMGIIEAILGVIHKGI